MNHALTNYHWAYEGYVLNRLELGRAGPFTHCLLNPRESNPFELKAGARPFEIADAMARVSMKLAWDVGRGNYKFFGAHLKQWEVSLPKNQRVPKYAEIAVDPNLANERKFLEDATCAALSNASWASHRLIEWVFE
jgi:hypothetical protein